MSILKLTEAGQTHTMTVKTCEVVKGKFGQQLQFGDGSDTIYLSYPTAIRQLTRCGLDVEGSGSEVVEGETLTFGRDVNPNGGAPYWSIVLASKADANPKPSKRLTGPDTRTAGQKELDAAVPPEDTTPYANEAEAAEGMKSEKANVLTVRYLALWDFMAKHLTKTCSSEDTAMELNAAAVNAAASTVWISLKDKGLV